MRNSIFWGLFAIFIVVIPLLLVWHTVNLYQQEKANRIVLDINSATKYQFSAIDGKLLAVGNDPNITFDDIPVQVGSILIDCYNLNPYSESQIFYRNCQGHFIEKNSITLQTIIRRKINSIFHCH